MQPLECRLATFVAKPASLLRRHSSAEKSWLAQERASLFQNKTQRGPLSFQKFGTSTRRAYLNMRKTKRRSSETSTTEARRPHPSGLASGRSAAGPSSASSSTTIIWLRGRGDLRVYDNPLLVHAQREKQPLIIIFTWSQADATGPFSYGDAQRAFMFSVIDELHRDLKRRYIQDIHYVRLRDQACASDYVELFDYLGKTLRANVLLLARRYEPPWRQLDDEIEHALKTMNRWKVFSYNMHLLHEPGAVGYTGDSPATFGHFGTLLPFYRAWERNAGHPPQPSEAVSWLPEAPQNLPWPETFSATIGDVNASEVIPECRELSTSSFSLVPSLQSTGLHPVGAGVARWDITVMRSWDVREEAVRAQLRQFLQDRLPRYESSKSRADRQSVSRLSPFLALGVVSVREMYHETRDALRRLPEHKRSKTFARRLIWRELAYWTLHHFPEAAMEPIRSHYTTQEWNEDPELIAAWQQGRTGYPLIDAGMRQLWQTGWMPQNIRMAVASFLIEYLNIHWMHGLQWFHHTLVDLDIAINAMMWQNAGRSGLDMWNFVIHPVTSSRTSDPTGAYVRQWIPELSQLPNEFIHAPWAAPESVRQAAAVRLGDTYPERIVNDLAEARRRSKRAVLEMRCRTEPHFFNDDGYDRIRVPILETGQSRLEHTGRSAGPHLYVWRHVFTRREFRGAPFGTLLSEQAASTKAPQLQPVALQDTPAAQGKIAEEAS
ncbi:hypothetical protein F1559_004081 [Cyanidiococcus yangmingshanensis]|uniref:Photolyase/cryptochrome alpha/beta domain-containing protein n=1 Tax=Cyanidiococcus yangmingshanensis TaxID=2690220 RepID=A0A7J7IFU3_9RHOD|nr:hypothetical protein F1559_004081 [Cyanidiococcus yangmingshanensis]